jgi:hypothetical protein
MNVQQSKRGQWFIGPMPKPASRWRWIGPYETKARAESDRIGIARFIRKTK